MYRVPRDKLPIVPLPDQDIHTPPAGYTGVYLCHLKAGLRFPMHGFIGTLLAHYGVHLVQIAPNGFRKILNFIFICKVLDISPTIDLFKYFYVTAHSVDWLSFSKRSHATELCLGLPSSIKKWKNEYFLSNPTCFLIP